MKNVGKCGKKQNYFGEAGWRESDEKKGAKLKNAGLRPTLFGAEDGTCPACGQELYRTRALQVPAEKTKTPDFVRRYLVRKTGLALSADRSGGTEKQSTGLFPDTCPSSPGGENKNVGLCPTLFGAEDGT